MPRPPVYETGARAVPPPNLEELRFWLMIMQEHALFIKAGLPAENKEAIAEAQEFYREFGVLLTRADKAQSEKKFAEVLTASEDTVERFYRFKRGLLQLALRGKLGGCLFPLLLDHMAREAEYFLRLLHSMRGGDLFSLLPKTAETQFWVRLMGDHSDFIRQKLDPSEVNLIGTADEFSTEFHDLFRESVDFSSMLRGVSGSVPPFSRFLQDTRAATLRLRDFQKALYVMITEDRVLSIIPALLADHVRREADHFLMIAAMLDKSLQTPGYTAPDTSAAPLESIVGIDPAETDACEPVVCSATESCGIGPAMMGTACANPMSMTDPDIIEECDEEDVECGMEEMPVPFAAPVPQFSPAAAPGPPAQSQAQLKYKWSNAWPRPLGGK